MKTSQSVAVIGAGIHGLAAAWHLSQRPNVTVTVFEQHSIGHLRGSSHGAVRITRSTYPKPGYVRLAQRARAETWPTLESALKAQLIEPMPGCIFGPAGGIFDEYAAGVEAGGGDVLRLSANEARDRFPGLTLDGCEVLWDRSAGVVRADATLAGLARLAREGGVQFRTETAVQEISLTRGRVELCTQLGAAAFDRVIVAAGPWTPRLLPDLPRKMSVVRQAVGFFTHADGSTGAPADRCIWIHLGVDPADHYYGLPVEGVLKAAQHIEAPRGDDPDTLTTACPAALSTLDSFVERRISPAVQRVRTDTCCYTNTPNADFIVSPHPDTDRIIVGAGFSGHSFKFGPLIGQILADLATEGTCTLPEYQALRPRFALVSSK